MASGTNEYLKKGERGEEISQAQKKLNQLGFSLETDGIFGDATEKAVRELQSMFGYDADGIVGPGTRFLMDQQLGLGWNLKSPDAKRRAMEAQGKAVPPAPATAAPTGAGSGVQQKKAPPAKAPGKN